MDPWNDIGSSTTSKRAAVPVKPVPDSWDDDEDEDDNQKIWEDANSHAPMPQLIITNTSTSAASLPPPAAAIQPAMRILKRSPTATPQPTPLPNSTSHKTLAEREAQYQAARQRIFANSHAEPIAPSISKLAEGKVASTPMILRDPRGPEFGDGKLEGFSKRTITKPDSNTHTRGQS
ncbi:hypothetical protein PUNSTDRAFT_140747 [Punctularia strigosozonata HHB-11173 SS5]|uniref:uncharacterized protein n=1 Tax=Punctularia strigosozonata (strain HHB-11173) TaxID=741275 RepID=UPI0004416FC9|nr:uncharacterized protein PUNSTDRAFT_140747 [Punctularia strigosozonata HHB-11173 SS5]EIN14458.1 hypothetical protein PUNSTDRAFT_140747 [Punctularia strigosozonata HHB-11173 SS5]